MKDFVIFLSFFVLLAACIAVFEWKNQRSYAAPAQAQPEPEIDLAARIDSLGIDLQAIYLTIDKSDYELKVMADTVELKSYSVVFGGNPVDDKLQQGDQCTPEGVFHIKARYPHNKWSKFMWIDYPTADSWKKHQAAKAKGLIPQNAAIGGEIGIHGVPKGTDPLVGTRHNWTLGCISMRNEDVNEIYPFVEVGTEVIISR